MTAPDPTAIPATPAAPLLWFVFDPFCGWCYAAHPAMQALADSLSLPLQMWPSGQFARPHQRPMTREFSNYAWENDQHIQQLTGQVFSPTYQRLVLGDYSKPFDSWAATLAFHVLESKQPERGIDILHRLQRVRYVMGNPATTIDAFTETAEGLGWDREHFLQACALDTTQLALRQRIDESQRLMQQLRLRGVPDLLIGHETPEGGREWQLIPSALLYRKDELVEQVKAIVMAL